jgi:hypothetical protein
MKQSGKTKTDMLALCTSAILELNTKGWLETWKAGVVGIGAIDGITTYDSTGGITTDLDTGFSDLPSPTIESYIGD